MLSLLHLKAFAIVGPVLSSEPYGIMIAKDDPKFKAIADRTVNNLWKTGQMDALYKNGSYRQFHRKILI